MTSWAVIDSGILLATVLIEQYSKEAKALIKSLTGQQTQIAVPVLFRYEIVAVMRKHVYRGTLTAEEANNNYALLLAQPVQAMVDDALLRRGYELAAQFNRPTAYDSQYLAVAERLGCEFWTADERLYNALNTQLSWVKWLGSFKEPPPATS
jgi:predicted nucleic acid-binding protein